MNKETITYKGIDFDVDFYYQPGEKEVRYYSDGSGYPGCDPSIEINEITHKGTDFSEFLFDPHTGYEEIEKLLWQKHEDYKNNNY